MAVYLSLTPGQALVEQSFQRALDAEIPLLDIPEHRADLLCRSRRVNLAARNYRQPTFAVCSGVIGQWIIGSHLLIRFWWFFWLRQRVKSNNFAQFIGCNGGSPP
jgi:hypothetical protein